MGASSFERRLGEVGRKIASWLRRSRKAAQQELHSGHGAKNAFQFCAASLRSLGGAMNAASAMGLRV